MAGTKSNGLNRVHLAVIALALVAVAAAEGQVLALPDMPTFRCGTSHELPDGPRRAIHYQGGGSSPAGSVVEIGVLFLYTDHFTASETRTRVREWVETANELFDAGTSGIRLKNVGVEAAPPSVSRHADDVESQDDFEPVVREAARLHGSLHGSRQESGADVVIVVAPGSGSWVGGMAAATWTTDMSAADMKRQTYAAVRMTARGSTEIGRRLEGHALAHQIGHLLGLFHDAAAIDAVEGAGSADWWRNSGYMHDSKGFGYVNPEVGSYSDDGEPRYAGTVMAYSYFSIAGFSRPNESLPVEFNDGVFVNAGDSTTWADRALRKTATAVAGFYTETATPDPDPDPEPPPPPTGGQCTLTDGTVFDCHTTAAGHVYGVQYFHQGESKWAEIGVRSGDSAVFHFFGPENLEVFAKVLDGCAIDGTFWVYASGLTDLPIALQVWPASGGTSTPFLIPDGIVLRPNNGGRLNWCER